MKQKSIESHMSSKIFENPTAVQLLAVHLPFYKSGINTKITSDEAIKALEQIKEVTKVFADNLHGTIMLPKIIFLADDYIDKIKSHKYNEAELKYLIFRFNRAAEKIIKIVDQYRQNMLKSLDQICDVVNNEKKDTISCLIQNLIHE